MNGDIEVKWSAGWGGNVGVVDEGCEARVSRAGATECRRGSMGEE